MIAIQMSVLARIEDAARRALPREACGFLIGHDGDRPIITRIAASPNLAPPDRQDRFETDPRLHLRLQRDLRESADDILGIYHSHPGGRAAPSAVDRAQAVYPGWIWLITALNGADCSTCAFRHIAGTDFAPLRLETVSDPSE